MAIDATTLEANAAMRSIVRRDTGESYQEFLTRLAEASGIKTPTREDLARLDRRRKKRTSNEDWENPHDPDAKITKMKDGRTHLAHKAEHAVDLDTGALVAVTLQGATSGTRRSLVETAIKAARADRSRAVARPGDGLAEIVADKGYHSNQTMIDLDAVAVRTYIAEPDRGRRQWDEDAGGAGAGLRQSSTHSRRARHSGSCVAAASTSSAPSPTCTTPAACAGRTCAVIRTSSNGCSSTRARSISGLLMRKAFGRGTPRGLARTPVRHRSA